MDFFELAAKRGSYRGMYESTPVPREDLMQIMQVGADAPSGCNSQLTEFIAVDDKEKLSKIYSLLESSTAFVTAPAVICVLTRAIPVYRDKCFNVQDYSASIQNMLLAITSMGYESCWVEGHITDDDKIGRKIADMLNVPQEYELVCLLPIGTPKQPLRRPIKKAIEERVSFNSYGVSNSN